MTSPRLTLLPSPEPSTPEREPQRDPRTHGAAKHPRPWEKHRRSGGQQAAGAAPRLGSPCWGPYPDPAWLGFQGVCGARPLRISMKKKEGIFSSLTLFPVGHLLGQGLIPVFQQFYPEGHTLLTEIQLRVRCGYSRKIYSRLQLISLINWLSSRNLWSEAYHWERKLEKEKSRAYALIILPSPSKLNSALKVRSTSHSVTSLKTGLP